ncbi:MAG TPA: tetratricopeptide repeat protein [Mucilaginibacter sp.]|nr:tetratricopeptide repeat protein [Mucilaginibacter sp.]
MKIFTIVFCLVLAGRVMAQDDIKVAARKAYQAKKWEEAVKLYKQVRAQQKDNISLYYIASAEIMLGQYEQAKTCLDTVLLQTERTDLKNYSYIQLAKCYAALHDSKSALASLQNASNHGWRDDSELSDTLFSSIRNDADFKKIQHDIEVNGKPCILDSRYQKLNFFVGIWDVYIGNKFDQKVAVDTVTYGPGNCAVFENFKWTGGGNYKGRSMIFFDISTLRYRMCWAGSSGDIRNFEEISSENNKMILQAVTNSNHGEVVHRRMTITYNPADNSVHQFIENSFDFGKTWVTDFDAMFRSSSNKMQADKGR